MAQSLVNNVIHLIFSTQHRHPWLRDAERSELHAYMGGILAEQGSRPLEINSVADHVHLLFALSKNIALAKMVEHIKTHTSLRLRDSHPSYRDFHWQRGYGGFGVSPTHVPQLREYVQSQPEHHRKLSFQEEYRRICEKNRVDLDERYVWD